MRTFVKLGSVSMMALMVACGGSSSGEDAHDAIAPQGGPDQQQPGPQAGGDVDHTGDINALVAAGGDLTTDAKADAAPVQTSAPVTSSAKNDSGTDLTCTTTGYSLTKVPSEFVLLSPNADVLWPGSLVQGKSMANGVLDPIPVKRAPGTITLSLASSSAGNFSKSMDTASLSNAVQAQNDILAGFTGATPAMFSIEIESVYSNEQLAVAIDAKANGETWTAAASLKFDQNTTKSHVLIKFSQQYYTMAFEPPQGASGVFDKSVTAGDLAPYVGAGNPAVYVSSVTYGRIFYLLFESSGSQKDLEAAISGSYSGASVSASASATASWQKTINSASIKSYAIGGNADAALGAVTAASQFDKVLDFLKQGASFDKTNPGVPVSYELRNLNDSSQVKLALTTAYSAKDCEVTNVTPPPADCAATDFSRVQSNGAYAVFHAAKAASGTTMWFPDGSHEEYHFPTCRRVYWGGINAVCTNGSWALGGSVSYDADCVPAD
ncbi:MAG TPA: thiol-activated cytolysin family protein, partial [Labilithrix sp.]